MLLTPLCRVRALNRRKRGEVRPKAAGLLRTFTSHRAQFLRPLCDPPFYTGFGHTKSDRVELRNKWTLSRKIRRIGGNSLDFQAGM